MTIDELDVAYAEGRRRSLIELFSHFARQFRGEDMVMEQRLAALEAERLEAISELRRICAAMKCNGWPDDLRLGDILKRLAHKIGVDA